LLVHEGCAPDAEAPERHCRGAATATASRGAAPRSDGWFHRVDSGGRPRWAKAIAAMLGLDRGDELGQGRAGGDDGGSDDLWRDIQPDGGDGVAYEELVGHAPSDRRDGRRTKAPPADVHVTVEEHDGDGLSRATRAIRPTRRSCGNRPAWPGRFRTGSARSRPGEAGTREECRRAAVRSPGGSRRGRAGRRTGRRPS
jgi:hypothetical protein